MLQTCDLFGKIEKALKVMKDHLDKEANPKKKDELQKELDRLQKKLADLRKEREVLKAFPK